MTDPSIAIAPTPPKIDKLTTARPCRVAFYYNLTPIYEISDEFVDDGHYTEPDKNKAWRWLRSTPAQEYCRALGFETSFMVYNGTENRALTWLTSSRMSMSQRLSTGLTLRKAVPSLRQRNARYGRASVQRVAAVGGN